MTNRKNIAANPPGIVRTQADLATAAGVSRTTAIDWTKRQGFPAASDAGYSVWLVAAWYFTLGPGAPKRELDDDAMMAGGGNDSPWLEAYRREKTLITQLDRRAKQTELIPQEFVTALLSIISARLRALGERLDEQPATDLRDVIAEIESDAKTWISANIKEPIE
jgi:hypothetical protein